MYEYISSSQNIGRRGFLKERLYYYEEDQIRRNWRSQPWRQRIFDRKKRTSSNEATFTGDFTAPSRKRSFFSCIVKCKNLGKKDTPKWCLNLQEQSV